MDSSSRPGAPRPVGGAPFPCGVVLAARGLHPHLSPVSAAGWLHFPSAHGLWGRREGGGLVTLDVTTQLGCASPSTASG